MTNDNAALANDTPLQPRTAASGDYTFFCETDADLTTSEGRIEWFCAHFGVAAPALEYDEDEPDQILLTDELLQWTRREGVNLDWTFGGCVSGALATYREKYKITEQEQEFLNSVGKLKGVELEIFMAGLTIITKGGADIDNVMRGVAEQIEAHRAAAPVEPQ